MSKTDMSKSDIETQTAPARTGVIAKLAAHKAAASGEAELTLPETGVVATYPKFRNHGVWQRAMRRNKGNVATAQIDYVTQICRFDGEKITLADWDEYMPMADANELLAAIFAGDDDEDGNAGE